MRMILLVVAVMVGGCATRTVPEILEAEPFLTMDLRGDPKTAAKCVVAPIDQLGWHATVRDYGNDVQVIWHVGTYNQPFAIFSLSSAGSGRTRMEARTRVVPQDAAKTAETWRGKLADCR